MKISMLFIILVLISSCGSKGNSNSASPTANVNQVEVQKTPLKVIDTDASDILRTQFSSDNKIRVPGLSDAWFKDKIELQMFCFTGELKKTEGLSKIIYQIDSKFNQVEKYWSYNISSYRIQSVDELINVQVDQGTLKKLGRVKFEQFCGHNFVNKVYYGQQAFLAANIAQINKNIQPSNFTFSGTTNDNDRLVFVSNYQENFPYFTTSGILTLSSGFSGGLKINMPNPRLKDMAEVLINYSEEYSERDDLKQEKLKIYGIDTIQY